MFLLIYLLLAGLLIAVSIANGVLTILKVLKSGSIFMWSRWIRVVREVRMVRVDQVVKVVHVVHVVQVVQVVKVVKVVNDDVHLENIWFAWSKPSEY